MADNSCKACRGNYQITNSQMERLLKTSAFAPELRVNEEQYHERLRLCETCPKLLDKTTCGVCGCIIPVVAWLKERSCPLPGGSLWGSVK
ncbi:DUF6171 family protein [Paenibacillus sp. M1]|uniref:DUF6171 family protein n=1 Tax=Paenibacillus haidiansis TaxID=1574488 RepID=A0ABU7VNP4_9BACL